MGKGVESRGVAVEIVVVGRGRSRARHRGQGIFQWIGRESSWSLRERGTARQNRKSRRHHTRVSLRSVCAADPCAKCRKQCDWSDAWATPTTSVTSRPAFRTGRTRMPDLSRTRMPDLSPASLSRPDRRRPTGRPEQAGLADRVNRASQTESIRRRRPASGRCARGTAGRHPARRVLPLRSAPRSRHCVPPGSVRRCAPPSRR